MLRNSKNRDKPKRNLARHFRREMGVSERVFWEICRKERLGFAFRRQVPVGSYILDFYCAEASLCVEIDGEQHDPHRDQARDEVLRQRGIETFRIPSLELFDLTSVRLQPRMKRLVELLEQRSGRPAREIPRLETKKRQRRYKL